MYRNSTLAMTTVRCQRVTVGTNASERSRNVVTAERTLVAHLLTLVDVLAHLHRSGSETFGTVALETTFYVCAGTVAANIGHGAFVVVCEICCGLC